MENNDKQIELKFQRFYTVNFPKVKNFAQMLLKSESDAEDVAQDVFCKLWMQPELWPVSYTHLTLPTTREV